MKGFDPATAFGEEIARSYDEVEARGDEVETVRFLARLAGDRDVLELAIGTGRIALPLAATGVRVEGIEISQPMVDQLRAKSSRSDVVVTMGDMSTTATGRRYGLVYLVYNTIGNLLTQDDQLRCFANAARHLDDDGVFVLECQIPNAPCRPGRHYVDAERVAADSVEFDVGRYNPVTQILDENHVRIDGAGATFRPISLRLAHPPEFDLMARIAGMRLQDRFGGWNREPFTVDSWRHISIYEKGGVNRPLLPMTTPIN